MTTSSASYSSADLEALSVDLPRALAENGVSVSPAEFSTIRTPDVYFVHPIASIDDVLELLRLITPRVVYVSPDFFDPDSLVDVEDRDLAGLEEILRQAREHEGDLSRLSLTWASDGLVHTWFATPDWYDALSDEADIAVEAAKGLHDIDRDLRQQQFRKQFARCKAAIFNDPNFRGATVNKRTPAAKAVLASTGEVIEDPYFERHLLRELREEAALEVIRQEQILGADLAALADRVVTSNGWFRLPTLIRQRAAISSFVLEVAEGWMLSDDFIERLRAAIVDRIAR
ncbi:hypothetical protein [Microbacterium sp. Bi128]|uniref:hypothetical protein n=1 Tax=Microbacterium sp. Bi128 TaxID=2821115 RepID=UPI001E28ADF5|nr:hypothetical protein [Microbacterium sp. Bi128]